jgi:hypothetical protein
MNETVANGEFDLTKLFEEDDAAISAPDPLVSRGAVNDNEMPEEFYIFDSNIIEDLNKLHNDNTANLNETALSSQSSNLSWCIQDSDFLSFI